MVPTNRRLDSWKEIAEYLDRDVRTAIRWEKEKDLPVYRVPGGVRKAVFTYTQELDAWIASRETSGKETQSELPVTQERVAPVPAPPPGRRFPLIRSTVSWSVGLAALIVAVGIALLGDWKVSSAPGVMPLGRPLEFARADYDARRPMSIAAGDFNGDGKLDLIFTNSSENSVTVLLGNGDGSFGRRVTTPAGERPERIAVGDFNGDGKLDVALTHMMSRDLRILKGNGDGSFSAGPTYPLDGRARSVEATDLNGDGKLDLVVAASAAERLKVFFGNGDGTFRMEGDYEAEKDVSSIAVGDFNQDGRLDIATGDYLVGTGRFVSVYLRNADGSFGSRIKSPCGTGPLWITSADLNNDGKLDLVTADFQGTVSVLLGKGDGTFDLRPLLKAGDANGFVQIADMDRDGRLDLVVLSEHSDDVSILFGHGDGTFDPPIHFATGQYPDASVIADFDGDGRLDLATANVYGDSVSVFLNRAKPAAHTSFWGTALHASSHF